MTKIISNSAMLLDANAAKAELEDHAIRPAWKIDAHNRLSFLAEGVPPYALYQESAPDGSDEAATAAAYWRENGEKGFCEFLAGFAPFLAEPLGVLVIFPDVFDGNSEVTIEYRVVPGSRNLEKIDRTDRR